MPRIFGHDPSPEPDAERLSRKMKKRSNFTGAAIAVLLSAGLLASCGSASGSGYRTYPYQSLSGGYHHGYQGPSHRYAPYQFYTGRHHYSGRYHGYGYGRRLYYH